MLDVYLDFVTLLVDLPLQNRVTLVCQGVLCTLNWICMMTSVGKRLTLNFSRGKSSKKKPMDHHHRVSFGEVMFILLTASLSAPDSKFLTYQMS